MSFWDNKPQSEWTRVGCMIASAQQTNHQQGLLGVESLFGSCAGGGPNNSYWPVPQPDADGWYDWMDKHPPYGKLIQMSPP